MTNRFGLYLIAGSALLFSCLAYCNTKDIKKDVEWTRQSVKYQQEQNKKYEEEKFNDLGRKIENLGVASGLPKGSFNVDNNTQKEKIEYSLEIPEIKE